MQYSLLDQNLCKKRAISSTAFIQAMKLLFRTKTQLVRLDILPVWKKWLTPPQKNLSFVECKSSFPLVNNYVFAFPWRRKNAIFSPWSRLFVTLSTIVVPFITHRAFVACQRSSDWSPGSGRCDDSRRGHEGGSSYVTRGWRPSCRDWIKPSSPVLRISKMTQKIKYLNFRKIAKMDLLFWKAVKLSHRSWGQIYSTFWNYFFAKLSRWSSKVGAIFWKTLWCTFGKNVQNLTFMASSPTGPSKKRHSYTTEQ
jgi:hypothetical protein